MKLRGKGKYERSGENPSSRYAKGAGSRAEGPADQAAGSAYPGEGYSSARGVYANGYGAGPDGYAQGGYGAGPEGYAQGGYGAGPEGYAQGGYGAGPEGYGQGGYGAGPEGYAQGGYGAGLEGYGQGGYGAGPEGYGQGGYGPGPGTYGQGAYGAAGPGAYNNSRRGTGRKTRTNGAAGANPYAGLAHPPKKKRRAWKFVLELVLLLILAIGVFGFSRLGKIDRHKLGELALNSGVTTDSGYRTFVLYGVDSREGELTSDCHSDTIMICVLNKKTKEVRLASVYRDTYLDNTNGEYRKATECYFYGGPERSVSMLNKNLDLAISDYIAVNFNAVVKVIDLLGGIDLEITDEEMEYINGYCVENEQVTGVSYTPLSASGYVHLDGIQALAYCRIRYTEGWDFKRTERQRTVLTLVYQKAASQGATALLSIANTMLPEIATNMGNIELLGLVSGIGSYNLGSETGFPFDQAAADLAFAGDCVVPVNLAANVTQLHEFLYDEAGYVPSATVQEISDTIASDTGIY